MLGARYFNVYKKRAREEVSHGMYGIYSALIISRGIAPTRVPFDQSYIPQKVSGTQTRA